MKLTIKKRVFNEAYYPYLWDTTRYLHFYGGSGSGKSMFVAQMLILRSFKTSYDTLVIRKVEKTLKESVYKLIKSIIYNWNLQDEFEFYKQPALIENKLTGHRFVFSGLDDPEKIKSIAGIQKVWIEEATELTFDDFKELRRRVRGVPNPQIILSYNPINENHWLKTKVHNLDEDNTKIIKTTFLDNKFLLPEDKEEFEYLKRVDPVQYQIYALGEWGVLDLNHKFDIRKVTKIQAKEPLGIVEGVKIFENPINAIYSMGIDASRGRQSGDFTSIKLRRFDIQTNQYKDVASYKGKADEQETFIKAYNLANHYNQTGRVYVIPEINNMGIYLVNKFRESDYPDELQYKRYITDPTKQRDGLVPDFGFQTTSKTRPTMINEFANTFNLDGVEIADNDEKLEMLDFVWNSNKNRYEAQENSHDDLLFADFLCLQGFKYVDQYG